MKRTLHYTFAFLFIIFVSVACKTKNNGGGDVTLALKGTWKPGTVLLNNTGNNLASTGQPYADFRLTIDGTSDESGSYTVSGMPLPFANTFSGTWTKTGNTFTFTGGAPSGITALSDFSADGATMRFVMVQTNPKVNVTLHFVLNKQ
jgi:hypothetical protein